MPELETIIWIWLGVNILALVFKSIPVTLGGFLQEHLPMPLNIIFGVFGFVVLFLPALLVNIFILRIKDLIRSKRDNFKNSSE
ncbi:MAG: hypothetical protein R3346_01305 [Candidatus Spechtbacterales bacterium]|nr:hypothetical protein [Candidatus Spechtbacterales bacterium]